MYMVPFSEAKDRGGKLVQESIFKRKKNILERDMQKFLKCL